MSAINQAINRILRNDSKVNTYKIALVRAINDVVLSFPDLRNSNQDVAIPLRILADLWIAYYWSFMDEAEPILQGPRASLAGVLRNDISFRPELTKLKSLWTMLFLSSKPADGYLLISEIRVPRKRQAYPKELHESYSSVVKAISRAIEYPIRYAGEGGKQYQVFNPPVSLSKLNNVSALPGATRTDKCVVVSLELWKAFHELSLWIEALCIHEWSMFTESTGTDRGLTYRLLTDRPDNRRPLTWERNEIELLMLEGNVFYCPWTHKQLQVEKYDVDHIIPLAVFPINEMWNLVPADSYFNSHIKRARIPSWERLTEAVPELTSTYSLYKSSVNLGQVLCEDVTLRFASLSITTCEPETITKAVLQITDSIAAARGISRF